VNRFPKPTAIGGQFSYRFDQQWLHVDPGHMATERTYVEFDGLTAFG